MALNIQDSRIWIKRSTAAGQVPTVAPSNDHTDGTWTALDIYEGELFFNVPDEKLYTRLDNTIVQLYPSGGGSSTLQDVTDNGATTDNTILLDAGADLQFKQEVGFGAARTITVSAPANGTMAGNTSILLPTVGGRFVISVNGTTPDAAGDVTVSGGAVDWGDIGGTLADQTDLQTALDGKVDENAAITGATKTKITYDAKGLVTAGADATTADIADSSNKRYVTDAQLTVIGNTSGTNTGDQDLSPYALKGTATDYFATSTKVGWGSYTVSEFWYEEFGTDMVQVWLKIAGTSNSTTTTVTLPFAANASHPQVVLNNLGANNGTFASKLYTLDAGSNVLTVSNSATAGGVAWTASGTKVIYLTFAYRK